MNDPWLDKIDAYLDGEMTPEEQSLFESELSANEELASAVRMYRTIETEMRSQQKGKASGASLRQTLEETGLRHFKGESTDTARAIPGRTGIIKKIPSRTIVAIAAAILVIFALGGVLYYIAGNNHTEMVAGREDPPGIGKRDKDSTALVKSPDQPIKQQNLPIGIPVKDSSSTTQTAGSASNKIRSVPSYAEQERLFASNFHPDRVPEDKGDLEEELGLYENGHYKEAIAALEDAKSTRGSSSELETFHNRYYLALSYMADRRVEKAIPELETALKASPGGFNRSKAQWYLTLAWLKKGEWVKAEKLLAELAGSKQAGEYKGKAAKLIEDLAKYR